MASAILNAPASSLELASRFSPATLYAALAVAAIAAAAIQSLSRRPPSGKIHDLGVFSFLSAWAFFAKRHDFIWATFKEVGTGMFRFRVLRHSVVALSGDTARKAFFTEPGLELRDGYALAVGAAPWLNDNVGDTNRKVESMFTKQVHHFFRTDRVGELLPVLFDDIQTHMESCGREGTINPFTEIYNLAFSMLVRLASCHELSKDKEALAQLARHYWDLEKSSTPFALMFPWFPGPGRRSIERATKNMCDLVSGFVELRRRATEPSSDAIDILIAEGATNDAIVAFTLGSLFAGLTPIGMSLCWNLLYLGMHPEWKAKVSAEIQAHLEQHTTVISSQPLHERLASIPISAWEHELPVLDSVVRETVRMTHGTQTLFRRNMGGDIYIDGSKIRSGEFLAYSAADVHRNPDIYSQPLSFDPARFNEDRAEDKKYPHAHVGWGSGRHPCAGNRASTILIKLVLALIFAGYEFEIVDATGKLPTELLWPDKNDILKSTPVGGPYFLKFRRVVD